MPKRVVIVGGGYIGVEFAGIFYGLGAQVTLIHRGERLLRGFDEDLRVALAAEMRQRGVELHFQTVINRIEPRGGKGVRVTPFPGAAIGADLIMLATGRAPNTKEIGLEDAGVVPDGRGVIAVDRYSQSSIQNIYAIGDVTNRRKLTPVAIAEGQAVAETFFGTGPRSVDYANGCYRRSSASRR